MVKRKSRPQIPKLSEAMKIVAGKKILLAAMLVRVQVPPGVQICTAKLRFRIKKVLQSYSANTFFLIKIKENDYKNHLFFLHLQ